MLAADLQVFYGCQQVKSFKMQLLYNFKCAHHKNYFAIFPRENPFLFAKFTACLKESLQTQLESLVVIRTFKIATWWMSHCIRSLFMHSAHKLTIFLEDIQEGMVMLSGRFP